VDNRGTTARAVPEVTMGILGLAALVWTVSIVQAPPAAKSGDFAAEYKALEREFGAAQEAYYEPYAKAKSDEEREKIVLDPAKEPGKLFAARFEDLAKRAKGTETGARSLLWVASNLREPGSEPVSNAIDTLTTEYIDSPVLADLARWLPQGTSSIGPERAQDVLELLAEKPKLPEVRAAAIFSLASIRYDEGKNAEAVELFRKLKKEYGSTPAAAQAEGYLFEIEHLQIGMAAPDFSAIDESGQPWKLSEYKGKVVVIDFWGFW
jgi:hypothetical protein